MERGTGHESRGQYAVRQHRPRLSDHMHIAKGLSEEMRLSVDKIIDFISQSTAYMEANTPHPYSTTVDSS